MSEGVLLEEVGVKADRPAAIERLLSACAKALEWPIIQKVALPILLGGLATLMSGFIAYYGLRYSGLFTDTKEPFVSYIDGSVARPAVFRVLIPTLLHGLYNMTPPALFDFYEWIERDFPNHGFRFFVGSVNDVSTRMLPYYYDTFFINFLALILTCLLLNRVYRFLFPDSGFSAFVFAPYLLLLAMIVTQGAFHLYDFPAMLSALALFYCVARRRVGLYLILFPLACLIKETAILLIGFFLVYNFDHMSRRGLAILGGLQALMFILIYGGLEYHFRNTVGYTVHNHLLRNLQWALRPEISGIVAILLFTFLIFFRWREKPAALRSTVIVMGPALALFFLGSFHGELRNLYELFPYAALLMCRNIELIARDCFGAYPVTADVAAPIALERYSARGRGLN